MQFSYFNVDTIFIASGLRENQSKFLMKSETSGDGAVQIEGKEGWFREKISSYDRYCARDVKTQPYLEHLSYSQFCQRYTYYKFSGEEPEIPDSKKCDDSDINEGNFIITHELPEVNKAVCLPKFIRINSSNSTEYFKLRSPRVIRYHKYNKLTNPHEYKLSILQLFYPHKRESDLGPYNENLCNKLFKQVNSTGIQKVDAVKMQLLKHSVQLQEAYQTAKDFNIGDILDPENELNELECAHEGFTEDPCNLQTELQPEKNQSSSNSFQKVQLLSKEQLRNKYLQCDLDQLLVIDIASTYANSIRKSTNGSSKPDKAPLVIVSGGAGTGKSHTINVLEQTVERILRKAGDELNCPYILKAAPTGVAAANISGTTLHSALSFSFGSNYESLSDKKRDLKRNELKNLQFLIVDEISMIDADMLYKLHLRLGEIKLKPHELFGGVAVFLFGDLLQLRPVRSNYIFEHPKNHRFTFTFLNDSIWKKFKPVILKTNHRQGENKAYAEILNRIRIGNILKSDLQALRERVIESCYNQIPNDVLFVTSTNAIVNEFNSYCLQKLPGEERKSLAVVERFEKEISNPKIEKSTHNIKNTPLINELKFKIGCKVMLTFNLDVSDGLINGAFGKIVDCEVKHDKINVLFVEFDNTNVGEKLRKESGNYYQSEKSQRTPIKKIEFPYRENSYVSSGRVFQFPLRLAFASTVHKIQGLTCKKPTSLVVDIKTSFEAAQAYVMLSRVQEISQILIYGEFDDKKIKHCPKALEEVNYLADNAMNSFSNVADENVILSCLNVYSLRRNIEILKHQLQNFSTQIIILQETWLNTNSGIYCLDLLYLHSYSLCISNKMSVCLYQNFF